MTKSDYLTWFDQVLLPTEPSFRRVPLDSLDFRLTEKSFSIGQVLAHIAGSFAFHAQVLRGEEPPARSLREILLANRHQVSVTPEVASAMLNRNCAEYKSAVQALTDEAFRSGLLDSPQLGRVPYWRYCVFVIEHHIHHLMELHLSLKVLGVDVNTKTLYRG